MSANFWKLLELEGKSIVQECHLLTDSIYSCNILVKDAQPNEDKKWILVLDQNLTKPSTTLEADMIIEQTVQENKRQYQKMIRRY